MSSTGPVRMLAAALARARLAYFRAAYGWRFAACGEGSVILRPDMLRGCEYLSLGRGVQIRPHARIEILALPGENPPRLEIGDHLQAEYYLHIGCARHVRIGHHVLLAGRVYITDHDHAFDQLDVPVLAQGLRSAPTEIGDYAWIGEGAVVLKGVTVGANAIVGANSVVTRSVPDNAVVAGAPARVLRFRTSAPVALPGPRGQADHD